LVGRIKVNIAIAGLILLAFSAADVILLGRGQTRVLTAIHFGIMLPLLVIAIWACLSKYRQHLFAPVSVAAIVAVGLGAIAVHFIGTEEGITYLFPSILLIVVYGYFLAGLLFYQALTANLIILLGYVASASLLDLPTPQFAYYVLVAFCTNMICAAVAYGNERTARTRFLEAHLLHEMVARDGLTGIHNRRMFDQHIQRAWQQATRERQRIAVLMADIDCFKDYNDRYGHQAGDECLRAVAVSLTQCARRPLDFVARYGGEEFGVVLYQASREYVAEVSTRIQRSIAELNIAHEASRVATRLTVSIGAAYVMPGAERTVEGLIQLADEALYAAKEQGRNQVVVLEAEYQNLKTGRFKLRRAGAD
jgi:diguanylate cyclase (GGDEF)-like protein